MVRLRSWRPGRPKGRVGVRRARATALVLLAVTATLAILLTVLLHKDVGAVIVTILLGGPALYLAFLAVPGAATAWRADYTSELIDLLNVLGLLADLEPEQGELLAHIIDGPVISVDELTEAHVLPVTAEARTPPKAHVAIGSAHEFWL